ncbi:MAG: hypothetical protein HYT08_04320 [Candidatus Levybacteria bacterium]|nr:hypothetical protein [Candidatus Levybacteria bacterium]
MTYIKGHLRETQDFVHAKLLTVDDGKVLFGSHNLTISGVNTDTQEIVFFKQ